MKFRIAHLSDIAQMQVVRHLVKENTLSDPNLVPDKDVAYYITEKGVGKELHRLMIEWYFSQTDDTIVLGTAPNTRAERFYALQGWKNVGSYSNGETKFELTFKDWTNRKG